MTNYISKFPQQINFLILPFFPVEALTTHATEMVTDKQVLGFFYATFLQ